ncbi:MAG: GDP-mannose 4,6-dehydratase, partial [Burkholderiales bacterium]
MSAVALPAGYRAKSLAVLFRLTWQWPLAAPALHRRRQTGMRIPVMPGRALGRYPVCPEALSQAVALPPEPGEWMVPTWLVTGGAGFIGGNFVLEAAARGVKVVNLDALTYAGNLKTLSSLDGNPNHVFVQGDIGDSSLVARLLAEHQPDAVLNFAAESHVDRS